MLSPKLSVIEITPELRLSIEGKILDALFESVRKRPPRRLKTGVPSLTVTQAKERLQIALPEYADSVSRALAHSPEQLGANSRDLGEELHEWLEEASSYFRREGADRIRKGLTLQDKDSFADRLWHGLFQERLLSMIESRDLMRDDAARRSGDVIIECMKKWTRFIAERIMGEDPNSFDPSAFFLDNEADFSADIERNGETVHLRGRPDAIFLDRRESLVYVWEYKFGRQGLLELQIAQVILYLALVEAAKGVSCRGATLLLFTLEEEKAEAGGDEYGPPFDPAVEKAFEGFIGNDRAVYQLKVRLTVALKKTPRSVSVNVMFCGPGGVGKTELARRTAKALGLPFVDVPATSLKTVDDLISRIDETLNAAGVSVEEAGMDAGVPRFEYPPLVVFVDEIHALPKRADAFLNFFEPKERRAVCRHRVASFPHAAFLTATTDKGKLPSAFLSRFNIIDLRPYSVDEAALIAAVPFKERNESCPPDVAELLARIGRFVPRTIIERAKAFLELHEFDPRRYSLNRAGLQAAMAQGWDVDENGLTRNDIEYLDALAAGPRGLSALSALLDYGTQEIERVIEPFLFRLSAVRRTGRGREITEIGRELLDGTRR
jgi:Holliday junction DNA helicase RuvB